MCKTDIAADRTSKKMSFKTKLTGSSFVLSGIQLHPEWQAPEPRVQRHHVGVSLRRPGRPGVPVLSGVVRPDPLPAHRGTCTTCGNSSCDSFQSLKIIQIALPRLIKKKKNPSEYYATGAEHFDIIQIASPSWLCHLFLFYNPSRTSLNAYGNTFNKHENTPMMDESM